MQGLSTCICQQIDTTIFFKGHGFQLLTHSLDYPITTEVENISGNPGLFPATFLPSDPGLFPATFLTKFLWLCQSLLYFR